MLVSAILCTHNNRRFLPTVIASYLSQDWMDKELVVIDDGSERVDDLFENIPNCAYLRLPVAANNLSVKRNIATRFANGEILVHFDSDDWSAPERISHQVEHLLSSGGQICGYHTAYFWDEIENRALYYHGQKGYSWGPCLCYYRQYALDNPWCEDVAWGEDGPFIKPAQDRGEMVTVDGTGMIVVRRHKDNAKPLVVGFADVAKAAGLGHFTLIPKEHLPSAFAGCL